MRLLYSLLAAAFILAAPALAAEKAAPCQGTDKACLLKLLENDAAAIPENNWRDGTYRETAKLLTLQGRADDAIALIGKIKNPDTQAMTIRGIGMAEAKIKPERAEYERVFARLQEEAAKIDHPPSHAIALTYIAMAQAFAGDDAGAAKTAGAMENDALRHKAFGETAEIQAERGDLAAATASIASIGDPIYQDKSGRTVSKIFADGAHYDSALAVAQNIKNEYQRAQAILYILVRQISPEEVSVE